MHTDTHTPRQELWLQPLIVMPGTSLLNLTCVHMWSRQKVPGAGVQGDSTLVCMSGERAGGAEQVSSKSRGHRKAGILALAVASRRSVHMCPRG